MTSKIPPHANGIKERHQPRGDLRYLIGAAALVVVVGALALVFGIVRPPAFESLSDGQRAALPGGVAWTEYNERVDCTDLMVARSDGEVESITCAQGLDQVIGWTEEGITTMSYGENGEVVSIRDPETGEVLSSRNFRGFDEKFEHEQDGGAFTAERKDGVLTIVDRSGDTVVEIEADARYQIGTIKGSPDGTWVAMTDSAERLLAVPADGSASPAVWATGLTEWRWMNLVWEGTEPPA